MKIEQMKNDDIVADKKKRGASKMAKKNNFAFLALGLIVIVALSFIVFGGKQCPLSLFKRDAKIAFRALQGGIQFKAPGGADVTLSVVSSEVISIKSVKRDGQDTIIRLSPATKSK